MKDLLASLFLCFLTLPATAQICGALAPSGQPALAAIRPDCQNEVAAAMLCAAGNPNFALHPVVVHPGVPAGQPMFLLLGVPTAVPLPIGGPPLAPALGLPGRLAMDPIVSVLPAGFSGTPGNPAVRIPLPRICGPIGLVLSAQILVVMPAGALALTGATGISV